MTWLIITVKWHCSIRGLSGGYWGWYSGVLCISPGHHHNLFHEHEALRCFSDFLECKESWLHLNPFLPFSYNPESSELKGWFGTLCVSYALFVFQLFSLWIFLWRMKLLLIPPQEEPTKFSFSYSAFTCYWLTAEQSGVTIELFLTRMDNSYALVVW